MLSKMKDFFASGTSTSIERSSAPRELAASVFDCVGDVEREYVTRIPRD